MSTEIARIDSLDKCGHRGAPEQRGIETLCTRTGRLRSCIDRDRDIPPVWEASDDQTTKRWWSLIDMWHGGVTRSDLYGPRESQTLSPNTAKRKSTRPTDGRPSRYAPQPRSRTCGEGHVVPPTRTQRFVRGTRPPCNGQRAR